MDLRLEHLSFGYPAGFQLGEIDLRIPSGSFLGLIGPNGSGKSTLLALVSGVLQPNQGDVLLENTSVSRFNPRELARRMAVISAEQYFDFPFLVSDIVAMGRFPHERRIRAESARDQGIVEEALDLTDLTAFRDRPISQLSTGERQRALIARAVAQQPSIMLLDEPDSHLDLHHQLSIFQLLTHLNSEKGMTIVAVLHDLTAASAFCRELALLDNGKLISHGTPAQVITPETISAVYGPGVLVSPNPATGAPMVSIVAQAGDEAGR